MRWAGRIAAGATFLTLFLWSPLRVDAQEVQAGLRLLVNGEEIATTIVPSQRRNGQVFVPAAPIASKLDAALLFDPGDLSITVTDAFSGSIFHYEGTTGLVRRDGVLIMGFAPGVPEGNGAADLMIPLPLAVVLFSLEMGAGATGEQIALVSRVGAPEARISDVSAVRFQELRYAGYANQYDHAADGGLALDTRSRIARGEFETSMIFVGAQDQGVIMRSATLTYRHPSQNIVSAGFLRGTGDMGWMVTAGRGARWSGIRGAGMKRYSLAVYELLAGATNTGTRISVPKYEGGAILGEYSVGARSGAPAGVGFALGGGWLGKSLDQPAGLLSAVDFRFMRYRVRTLARVGIFGGMSDSSSNGYGLEARTDWTPIRQLQIGARYYEFSPDFRLPRPNFPEGNSRLLGLNFLANPVPRFRINASSTRQTPIVPDGINRRSRLNNIGLGFRVGVRGLNMLNLSASQFEDSSSTHSRSISFGASGGWRPVEWYFSSRRRMDRTLTTQSYTAGLVGHSPAGRVQFSSYWTWGQLQTAGLYWAFPYLAEGKVRASLGGRWDRIPSLNGRHLFGQLRVGLNFSHGHSADFTIEESQSSTVIRLAFTGAFDFPDVAPQGFSMAINDPRFRRGAIHGRVYVDNNLNRKFDEGDRPLTGVQVKIDKGNAFSVTRDDGTYSFPSVAVGEHEIVVTDATIRADLSLLEGHEATVNVPQFKTVDVDFRAAKNRSVEGYVFEDRNENGVQDGDEPGIPNVRLAVAGGRDALTYHDGYYRIGDLPPGLRIITVDRTSLPAGHTPPDPIHLEVPSDRNPETLHLAIIPKRREVNRNRFGDD